MQVAHYVREMTDATTRLEEDDPERETEEETDLKEFMHQLDLFMQTLRRKISPAMTPKATMLPRK